MSTPNPFRKFAEKCLSYPSGLGLWLLTALFRYKVKMVATAGLKITKTDLKSVTFFQKNRSKVQNHIGSVHAAAMALLAESATGFVVGINLPGDKLPLIKSMNLKYVKRSTGSLTAVAFVTDAQIQRMQSEEQGDLMVSVTVTDEAGNEPIICEMNWAWVAKSKPSAQPKL
jgi:acyl-coenzyme A thioesterase PaaI-like protein